MRTALRGVMYGWLLWCLAGDSIAQQRSGLLLTTTTVSGDASQPFHTYWVTRDGGQVKVVDGMRLLVPRQVGWWEIGITELIHVNSPARGEVLWAAPIGSHPPRTHTVPVSDDDTCTDDLSTYSISWVGVDFVALQHAYESTCGAHPVSGAESFVAKLDDLRQTRGEKRPQLKLSEIAGSEAARAMELGAEAANLRVAKGDENPIKADDTGWIVVRSKGRYRLLGATPVEHGRGGQTYDIPFDPPKSLTGTNNLSIGWDTVLDKSPDALDAYTSPNGDLLAIVTSRYLSLFDVKQGAIGERLGRIGLDSPTVIAAEWAIWTEVDRWDAIVTPLLKEAPFKPEQ